MRPSKRNLLIFIIFIFTLVLGIYLIVLNNRTKKLSDGSITKKVHRKRIITLMWVEVCLVVTCIGLFTFSEQTPSEVHRDIQSATTAMRNFTNTNFLTTVNGELTPKRDDVKWQKVSEDGSVLKIEIPKSAEDATPRYVYGYNVCCFPGRQRQDIKHKVFVYVPPEGYEFVYNKNIAFDTLQHDRILKLKRPIEKNAKTNRIEKEILTTGKRYDNIDVPLLVKKPTTGDLLITTPANPIYFVPKIHALGKERVNEQEDLLQIYRKDLNNILDSANELNTEYASNKPKITNTLLATFQGNQQNNQSSRFAALFAD